MLLAMLMECILDHQVVSFAPVCVAKAGQKVYGRQTLGILTGLICGPQIANCVMLEFDVHVISAFRLR